MIVKLGNILRALLREREAFVPLGEELAFTDDYLDIEVVRFGEKLRVVKEIAPETLEAVVPSMMAAAVDREQHQAWSGAAYQRGYGDDPEPGK